MGARRGRVAVRGRRVRIVPDGVLTVLVAPMLSWVVFSRAAWNHPRATTRMEGIQRG